MTITSRVRRVLAACSAVAALAATAHAAGTFTTSLLSPPNPGPFDAFGRAVATLGTNLVVGASGYGFFGDVPGRVFVMDARGHVLLTIENPTPTPNDEFGVAVAVVGGNVLVGAPFDDTAGSNAGAAYLFDGATGALLQTFLVPGSGSNDQCGRGVAALGGNALVQCDGAYLFDVTTGSVLQHFTTPSGVHNDGFGTFGGDVILGDGQDAFRLDGTTSAVVATYPNPEPGGAHPGQIGTLGDKLLIGRGFPHEPERVYLFDPDTGVLLHTFVGDTFGTPFGERFGWGVAGAGDDTVAVAAALVLYRFDGVTFDRLERYFPDDIRAAPAGEVATVLGTSYAGRTYDPSVNDGRGQLLLFDRCGNGIFTGGEQCDDGNTADGDGCSSVCHLELCPPTPDTASCHSLTAATKSTLKLQSKRMGAWGRNGDSLQWKWTGQATTLAEYGPPASTSYQLCIYQKALTTPALVLNPSAPAGNTCGDGPCWRTAGPVTQRYRDRSRRPSGFEKIELRAGGDGRAKIAVTAGGIDLGLPEPTIYKGPLPLTGAVAVVLRNSATGACWSATYAQPKNARGKLKAVTKGS